MGGIVQAPALAVNLTLLFARPIMKLSGYELSPPAGGEPLPLYEYECGSCGKRFEVIQKFSDEPLNACKHCGGPATRLVSPPAFQFKGTGWYITDYARKPTPDASPSADGKDEKGGKDKKDGEKPAASAETSKESKPASDAPAGSSSTKK